ncbi:MAG: anti-sigma factor antagonist [Planctomycetes bacterium]|nr:anti-sigma factor antagonist [Planctomycetota bacterium]
MKLKEVFPSAVMVRGILFVRVTDVLDSRPYLDEKNFEGFLSGLAVLRATDFENYALSFAGLTFVSSAALGQLVGFQEYLEGQNKRLLIYELAPKVKVVFEELGLDRYFDVYGLKGHVLRYFHTSRPRTRTE